MNLLLYRMRKEPETTPSVVAFTKNGERFGWSGSKASGYYKPGKKRFYSIKRFMGRRYKEVGTEIEEVPYKVLSGQNDVAKVKIDDKEYSPQEISAMVFTENETDCRRLFG